MKQFLAAAVLSTLATGAMAQATTPAHPAPATSPAATSPAATAHAANPANAAATREGVAKTLRDAGFTNVRVMPESFVVTAKDKNGNPVSMFISPDAVTEMTAMPAGTATANGTAAPTGAGMFATVPATDKVSSNLVGLDVYNGSNQDIGTIKDLVLENGQVKAYILSVGGFLGIGDHYVAVSPAAVSVAWNNGDRKWRASMNATADQLKQAPEFKYPSRS